MIAPGPIPGGHIIRSCPSPHVLSSGQVQKREQQIEVYKEESFEGHPPTASSRRCPREANLWKFGSSGPRIENKSQLDGTRECLVLIIRVTPVFWPIQGNWSKGALPFYSLKFTPLSTPGPRTKVSTLNIAPVLLETLQGRP